MPKAYAARDLNLRSSSVESDTLTIVLQDPCLQSILPSGSLSLPWLQRAGFSLGCSCGKQFLGLKTCFFGTALVKLRNARISKKNQKLRQARLCKKKTHFSGIFVSVCLLSNQPTPPRYLALARSKLRRCIQYITKNALRNLRGPRPIAVEICLQSFKHQILRNPRHQAFGFFTNSRAVKGWSVKCRVLSVECKV